MAIVMATIEPRLMHLLNESVSPSLPRIQLFPFPGTHDHSLALPPIDADGSDQRADKSAQPANPIPPIHAVGASVYSIRRILDDTPEAHEDSTTKKRHRTLASKDDFVQLPHPLKKQKSTQQVVPPIINGLLEPPPDAAVFPPIAAGVFPDVEAPTLNVLREFASAGEDRAATSNGSEAAKTTPEKTRRRAAKPRRKWTEEETNHLLLGVSRHGVGKWTTILEDPDFKFNDRTAGDLKDRFRTCCPNELRENSSGNCKPGSVENDEHGSVPGTKTSAAVAKKAFLLEDLLIDEEAEPSSSPQQQQDSDSTTKPRKSRAHRRKVEDLKELGIHGPFKKSHRRERRPFSEQDDQRILQGLEEYGPAWTKIQRDPRFNLSNRQPTDLRDRVRNKYPEIYARIDKMSSQNKETGRGGLLEPTVDTAIQNSLHLTIASAREAHLSRSTSNKDDVLHKWLFLAGPTESTECLATPLIDPSEYPPSGPMNSSGEMEISRVLSGSPRVFTEPMARTNALESVLDATSPSDEGPDSVALKAVHRATHSDLVDRRLRRE
ncbi:hypothetical protein VTK73DRAFT_2773 [Phialemonium thermophilum]|uniref:Uncharacterized protein n=1 Tax=Phialemonium thermophilum TaxID=223376 RepID=A0ABR3Y234_9PEZI